MNALVSAKPVLKTQDGRATTNSLDVAAFFHKRHGDVLRAIDALIADAPACQRNFAFTSTMVAMPRGGERETRSCDMDRTGFTLLAMGFTGATALQFKLTYVAAFDAMEEQLKAAPAAIDVRDPVQFAAIAVQLQAYTAELKQRVAVLEPKAEAFENLAEPSLGSWTPTRSAKALGVARDILIADLLKMKWVSRQGGDGDLVGYADAEKRGLVSHRQSTWKDSRGKVHAELQVEITPRGRQQLSLHYTSRPGTLLERRSPAVLPAPAGDLLQ